VDIKDRSCRYSPQFKEEVFTFTSGHAADIAAGWRDNATHTDLGADWVAHSWAVAAYFQYLADRNTHPERYTQD
jgi:hypothetical protein